MKETKKIHKIRYTKKTNNKRLWEIWYKRKNIKALTNKSLTLNEKKHTHIQTNWKNIKFKWLTHIEYIHTVARIRQKFIEREMWINCIYIQRVNNRNLNIVGMISYSLSNISEMHRFLLLNEQVKENEKKTHPKHSGPNRAFKWTQTLMTRFLLTVTNSNESSSYNDKQSKAKKNETFNIIHKHTNKQW